MDVSAGRCFTGEAVACIVSHGALKQGIVGMRHMRITSGAVPGWLKSGIAVVMFAQGMGVAGSAMARAPVEVDLASPAQALQYCQAGKLPKHGIAYFNGTAGDAQYKNDCTQAVPPARVRAALWLSGKKVRECKLTDAATAIALCNAGGIGLYDIAYIAGPAATVIGGPGYGCTTNITTLSIGNAVCR